MSFVQIQILGRLGGDPQAGNATASFVKFSIATDGGMKSGQKTTDWWKITCFGKTAEIAMKYCQKGKEVMVVGRPEINKYIDKSGVPRESVGVIADRIVLLGSGTSSQGQGQPHPSNQNQEEQSPPDYVDIPF